MTLLQSAFINVINLSIAASFLMLAVILLRPFLKRVPKWLLCALWALVVVRLAVPFSLESRWSLVPAWKVSVSHAEETQVGSNGNQSGISAVDDRRDVTVTKTKSEDHDAEHAAVISAEKELENSSEVNAWQGSIRENDGETVAHAEEINAESVASKQNDQDGIAINETKERPSENISENETATEMTDQKSDGRREETNAKTGKDENVIATEKSNVTTDESVASTGESVLRRTFTGVLLIVGSGIWLAGIIAMLAYIVISFVRLRIRLRTAVRLETGTDVKVWMSDAITEPFVLGIVRPNIYVPSAIEEGDLECVLRHEQAHVRRGDYLWKPLGFLILCVYWFHPLCWISYLLFCRDVEMACDEKATKGYDMEGRKRYCQALLNLSQGRKSSLIGTVAFGENGTKSRVKAVLNYKKPPFWVMVIGLLVCVLLGIFFMTSPNGKAAENLLSFPTKIQRTDIVYEEEGNAREISFDLKLRNSSNGVILSGSVLYDGNTYYDAKEVFKDNWEGDGGNLFFIPKDYGSDIWKDYVLINPLDDNMDSYLLRITIAGETKTYSSKKLEDPEGLKGNTAKEPEVTAGADKAKNQREVSLTDPQVLKTQILREISQMEFAFPSGACTGGYLVINEDGSFSGGYTTRYDTCHYYDSRFTGILEITKLVDIYTCQIKVTKLCCEMEPGTKWKDGECFYEEILPPGMTEGGEYLLCLPGKPVEELPRGILYWHGVEIEKAGGWNVYGIGAIPKTEEEGYTDLNQWKIYELSEYGEDLALYCQNVYPNLMKEWEVKALSPKRSKYLYGKSENQDGKTVLTIGVMDALEYHRPTEFQLNTESSNEIVKVYWLSDTLVGAEAHANSSAREFFVYDLETGKEVKHYVDDSIVGVPGAGKKAWENEGISISDFYAKDDGDIQNAYVIDENGVLWGYGENRYGQLGQGYADRKFYKEKVKVAENIIHVDDSETGFVIYLTEDHKLYGLGKAGFGTLLTGGNMDWSSIVYGEDQAVCSPVLLMEQVQYACCGRNDVVCLLEDGSVWTWGITGISTAREYYYMPEPVKILDGALLVTGGLFNHAALLSDGSVWTWGYNFAGGCGVPEFGIVDTPTKVAENVIRVWTCQKRTNTCADYENMSPINEKQMESTIIEKADHSFFTCGEGVGNEERILKKYYEAVDYPVICTYEFLPCTKLCQDGSETTAR